MPCTTDSCRPTKKKTAVSKKSSAKKAPAKKKPAKKSTAKRTPATRRRPASKACSGKNCSCSSSSSSSSSSSCDCSDCCDSSSSDDSSDCCCSHHDSSKDSVVEFLESGKFHEAIKKMDKKKAKDDMKEVIQAAADLCDKTKKLSTKLEKSNTSKPKKLAKSKSISNTSSAKANKTNKSKIARTHSDCGVQTDISIDQQKEVLQVAQSNPKKVLQIKKSTSDIEDEFEGNIKTELMHSCESSDDDTC